jgi:UDP-glucose 4-epimerase
MKILVTGGSGFIGSHLVEAYQNRAEVIVLDNFRTGHRKNLEGLRCRLVEGSITDQCLVDSLMQDVDYVFHLAALVSVPESMSLPAETVDINVLGLLHVLNAARQHGVKKLCFASSAAVYGENPSNPKTETLAPDPRSPYAVTKLDGEYYCSGYTREGWLPTACLRFFNVFGPRQDPNSAYAAAVPIFLQRAKANLPITIYGDGKQTRDFIFVQDIVGALAFAAENEAATGVFNAGYGQSMTIIDLVGRILALTGSESEIRYLPPRAGDIRHSASDPSRLLAAGWLPQDSLETGLRKLIDSGLRSD